MEPTQRRESLERLCPSCGADLGYRPDQRRNLKYCSGRCRTRAKRQRNRLKAKVNSVAD